MDANTALLIIGFIGYAVVNWKKGGNQASADVIALYKARDEVQDKQHKENKDQINYLTGEVGRLRGLIEEKDKRIATLEQVDISRNPVMLQFIEKINKSADENAAFINGFKDLPSIMIEIKTFMSNINAHMEKHG